MKKIYLFLLLIPIVLLAIIPPMELNIPMSSSRIFYWLALSAGFLGFFTLFLNINKFIKALTIYLFVSCFFSSAVYYSFAAYISYIVCLYFYIACLKIDDWKLVKKCLLLLLLLNSFLLVMQLAGLDRLLNFGVARKDLKWHGCYGTIGNFMCFKSFIFILLAFLISFYSINFKKYKKYIWVVCLFLAAMAFAYVVRHNIVSYWSNARGFAWSQTLHLTLYSKMTALFGWGMNTFGITFNALAQLPAPRGGVWSEGLWTTPHNDWLHILFTTGFLGLAFVGAFVVDLFQRLYKAKLYSVFIGAALIAFDMCIQFPLNMTQTIPLIILFCAYAEYKLKENKIL